MLTLTIQKTMINEIDGMHRSSIRNHWLMPMLSMHKLILHNNFSSFNQTKVLLSVIMKTMCTHWFSICTGKTVLHPQKVNHKPRRAFFCVKRRFIRWFDRDSHIFGFKKNKMTIDEGRW